jgi:hypothetical protein
MSEKCHNRTHAPQPSAAIRSLLDVGELLGQPCFPKTLNKQLYV